MPADTQRTKFRLTVYIAGLTPAAQIALANLETLCREHVGEQCYELEVIDINDNPQAAEDARILATPTVIKSLPPPIKRLIGDLTDHDSAAVNLDLKRI